MSKYKLCCSCALRTRAYVNKPQGLEISKNNIANSLTSLYKDSLVLYIK